MTWTVGLTVYWITLYFNIPTYFLIPRCGLKQGSTKIRNNLHIQKIDFFRLITWAPCKKPRHRKTFPLYCQLYDGLVSVRKKYIIHEFQKRRGYLAHSQLNSLLISMYINPINSAWAQKNFYFLGCHWVSIDLIFSSFSVSQIKKKSSANESLISHLTKSANTWRNVQQN